MILIRLVLATRNMRLSSIFILFITFTTACALQFPAFLKDKQKLTPLETSQISRICQAMNKNLPTSSTTIDSVKVSVRCYTNYNSFLKAANTDFNRVFKYGGKGENKGGYYLIIVPHSSLAPESMLPQKLKFSEAASTEVKELFKTKHEGRIATCPFRTWKLVTIINQPDDVKFRNIILDANGDDLVGWTTEGGNYAVRSLRVPKLASTPKPVGTAPAEGVEVVVNTPPIITYLSQGGGVWKPWPGPEAGRNSVKFIDSSIHEGWVSLSVAFTNSEGEWENALTAVQLLGPMRTGDPKRMMGYFSREDQVIKIYWGQLAGYQVPVMYLLSQKEREKMLAENKGQKK